MTHNILSSVHWFNRSKHLQIHQESLLALQIINDEDHPNMHFGKRQGGLSLLGMGFFSQASSVLNCIGIMNQCKSPSGRILIKNWICNPLKDRLEIEKRLQAVERIIELNEQRGIIKELQHLLRGIPRIRSTIHGIKGQPTVKDLSNLIHVQIAPPH